MCVLLQRRCVCEFYEVFIQFPHCQASYGVHKQMGSYCTCSSQGPDHALKGGNSCMGHGHMRIIDIECL